MRKFKVMLKPTKNCNLACRYCSVGTPKKEKMSIETFEKAAEKISRKFSNRVVNFTWGGGEPLLAGLNFYRAVMDVQRKLRKSGYGFENMIQTNATLIDDEWARFFKENKFMVGISIDGNKEVNDANRIFPGGSGTFDSIVNAMKILQEQSVKHSLLGVVNHNNRSRIHSSVEFMLRQKKPFKLYIATPVGRHEEYKKDAYEQNDLYEIIASIFDHWMKTGDKFAESSIKKYLQSVLCNDPHECTYLKDCQEHFLGIEPDGSVYPCACFTSELKEFCYGNIATDDIEKILNNPNRIAFKNRYRLLDEECYECEHHSVCYGGCPLKAILKNGDLNSRDYNCQQYKQLFSHIKEKLQIENNSG